MEIKITDCPHPIEVFPKRLSRGESAFEKKRYKVFCEGCCFLSIGLFVNFVVIGFVHTLLD